MLGARRTVGAARLIARREVDGVTSHSTDHRGRVQPPSDEAARRMKRGNCPLPRAARGRPAQDRIDSSGSGVPVTLPPSGARGANSRASPVSTSRSKRSRAAPRRRARPVAAPRRRGRSSTSTASPRRARRAMPVHAVEAPTLGTRRDRDHRRAAIAAKPSAESRLRRSRLEAVAVGPAKIGPGPSARRRVAQRPLPRSGRAAAAALDGRQRGVVVAGRELAAEVHHP